MSLDESSSFEIENGLIDMTNFEQYITCLYWVYQTVITVGYGDLKLRNTVE